MQCPKCRFEFEGQTTECMKCGVIFAKYDARTATPGVPTPLMQPQPDDVTSFETVEDRLEFRLRLFALPLSLLIVGWLVSSSFQPLIRIVLSMWVHESGHAATAWLCGFGAFPGPWRTPVSEDRHILVTILLLSGLGWGMFRAWKMRTRSLLVAGAFLLALQLFCTFLPAHYARALIIFGGDGGSLVLGALLMACFYAPRESAIHSNGLRWGFLVIGAAGFMDPFSTWWAARTDRGRIPFGEIEGVNFSDPTLLVDIYRWSVETMIARYVGLGIACLAVLVVVYALGILQARAKRTGAEPVSDLFGLTSKSRRLG